MHTVPDHDPIVKELKIKFKAAKIKIHVHKVALTGSTYMRFDDPRLGKLRIGDHNEKKNLGYRWQVRTDMTEHRVDNNKGHRQFFYPHTKIDDLVRHVSNYLKKIQESSKEPAVSS